MSLSATALSQSPVHVRYPFDYQRTVKLLAGLRFCVCTVPKLEMAKNVVVKYSSEIVASPDPSNLAQINSFGISLHSVVELHNATI